MREAGLAIAVVLALFYIGKWMRALDHWLESGQIQDMDDEEGQDKHQTG